jgi:hypothetical protein
MLDAASLAIALLIGADSSIDENIYDEELYDYTFAYVSRFFELGVREDERPSLDQPFISQMILEELSDNITGSGDDYDEFIMRATILITILVEVMHSAVNEFVFRIRMEDRL